MFPPDTPWPDVWVMTGALAAVTERIRFSTHVYVLPVRNPFVVAKAVGHRRLAVRRPGAARRGRRAGCARSSTQLEQPFERRGARMEEQIEVLRTLWRGGMVEHHGEFYDFDRLEMAPAPAGRCPILIGGHTDIALRRAARIGDGWMGVYYDLDGLKEIVDRLQGFRQEYGTADRPFEIQASIVDRLPTPDVCAELADEGVTCIITSAWMMEGLQFASLERQRAGARDASASSTSPRCAGVTAPDRRLPTTYPLMGRQN